MRNRRLDPRQIAGVAIARRLAHEPLEIRQRLRRTIGVGEDAADVEQQIVIVGTQPFGALPRVDRRRPIAAAAPARSPASRSAAPSFAAISGDSRSPGGAAASTATASRARPLLMRTVAALVRAEEKSGRARTSASSVSSASSLRPELN